MRKIAPWVIVLASVCSFLLTSSVVPLDKMGLSKTAYAQQGWKSEFNELCGRSQDADALTADELKNLIDRCDKLKPNIEKLDETERKVFLKRLQMCRDLFAFMLDTKGKNKP